MRVDGFFPALSMVTQVLFLVAGVYVYASLLRQIRSRVAEPELMPVRKFGWPEAVLALVLSLFFLLSLFGSSSQKTPQIGNREIILGAAFTLGLLLAIAGFLRLRRFDLNSLGG